jgi:hypothetical protein
VEDTRNSYRILVRNLKRRELLRDTNNWADNIKMNLKETRYEDAN